MARKRTARKRGRAGKVAKKPSGTSKKRAGRPAKKASGRPAGKAAERSVKKVAGKSAAKRTAAAAPAAAGEALLTLTEVSKRTGISMPTLQRYKKEYQKRLQTVGKGRTQRYKVESLDTFRKIKEENLKKRGRPRKAVATAAKPAAPEKAATEDLISLSEIGRRTGISYPTLLRYVRLHGDRIPSRGTGRKRRFPVAAVPIFSQLRKESRRGRRKGAPAKKAAAPGKGLEARMRQLEKSQAALEKQIARLVKALKRPLVKGI